MGIGTMYYLKYEYYVTDNLSQIQCYVKVKLLFVNLISNWVPIIILSLT